MKPKKIFIVDCDINYGQKLEAHLLSSNKYNVTLFEDGNSCIEQLYNQPDIIILNCKLDDIGTGYANGIDVLEEIKRIKSDVNVIMTSGSNSYGEAAQSIAKGAFSFSFKNTEDFQEIDKIISQVESSV